MPQGFASLSHKATFASSSLCCAYHVDHTTSRYCFVSLQASFNQLDGRARCPIQKTKRDQVIRHQQSRATAILLSPPFVGAAQPAGWQGTISYTKEGKKNNQAVTIDTNSNPVLLSFRRRLSTGRMAGHNVYYKRTKENNQAVTIDNNGEARAKVYVVVVVELE
jgi:hypothetical protein